MADPAKQPLVNNSLLSGYGAPAGNRDIGLMAGLQRRSFSVTGAVVNGAGANRGDDNARKDVCGRMTFTPFSSVEGTLALRAYYGWPGTSDTAWRTAAAEARFVHGPLEFQSECQITSSAAVNDNSWYLQAVWDASYLEPVVRFDVVLPRGSHSDWMVTGGLNLQPVHDHVRLMIDGTYRRNYQGNWSVLGFLFRIEASI
jgi:hypothetical protein